MKPEILYQLRFLSDLTEGPNGKPLFVLTAIEKLEPPDTSKNEEPPKYRPRLATWDGGLRLLTQGEARSPQWAGEFVYFTRKVDKVAQLFRLPLSGGEPEQITRFKAGVEGYKVSPEGSKIAILSRGDYEAPKPDQPRTYQTWPFKFEQRGLLPQVPKALYLWQDGQARVLVERTEDIEEVVWSPAGDFLVFTSSATPQEKWAWKQRCYRVNLAGEVQELFGGVGPVSGLAVTPDGAGLVYLAHAWEFGGATEARLYHHPFGGGFNLLAEGAFGNTVNSDCRYGGYFQAPRFGPDGAVYLVETYQGSARLMRVSLEGEAGEVRGVGESVAAYTFCGSDLYTLSESFTHPARLTHGGEVLFDPNAEVLPTLPTPTPIVWQSPEGHSVPGWVLLPGGEGPHPTILYIHGGPHTAFGDGLMLQLQIFRAAGYAVVYGNPRGSTGYGQGYTRLDGRWGEIDEADLLGLLEEALARFPLDRERVGVAGGSYGGYMTNCLTAHQPGRFKAAVTDRSICNWTSFFGASDIGPRFTWLQLGATPWERPEVLWQKSPLSLVHQVQTPTLVVHSEEDHRCPIDQGETWYTALLHLGVPTRFFRVPEEGHELSRSGRPDRRIARLEAYLEWWEAHLK